MRVLNLIIKQVNFDEIISGEKKTEERELHPKSCNKYLDYDGKDIFSSSPKSIKFKDFDALRLFVGYNPGRDTALVEVIGTDIIGIVDQEGNPVMLNYKEQEYDASVIEYSLGRILEVNGCKK